MWTFKLETNLKKFETTKQHQKQKIDANYEQINYKQ
jgi:hypothetical protein